MNTHGAQHLVDAIVSDQPLAILPAALPAIAAMLAGAAAAPPRRSAGLEARLGADPFAQRAVDVTPGAIGVLRVFGVLEQRSTVLSPIYGGTSTEQLGHLFEALRDAPDIRAIVLHVDSPGGSCYGVDELATTIRRARGSKPIVSAIDSLGASAAYWIAAQADSISVTPGGDAGHIGVIGTHVDLTDAFRKAGIKTTLLSGGRYKREGHPVEPLTAEARAAMQHRVDQAYARFVRAVAAGRGVPETIVRGGYGQGRLLAAEDARLAGLVDRIETVEAVIERLETTPPAPWRRGAPARAAGEWAADLGVELELLWPGLLRTS